MDNLSQFIDEQELSNEVRMAIVYAQEDYAKHHDKKRRVHAIRYLVRDIVVVRRLPIPTATSTKFQPKYRGPLVLTRVLPNDSYQITNLSGSHTTTAHCSQLKLFSRMATLSTQLKMNRSHKPEQETQVQESSLMGFRDSSESQRDTSEESAMEISRSSSKESMSGPNPLNTETDDQLAQLMQSFNVPEESASVNLYEGFLMDPGTPSASTVVDHEQRHAEQEEGAGGGQAEQADRYPK